MINDSRPVKNAARFWMLQWEAPTMPASAFYYYKSKAEAMSHAVSLVFDRCRVILWTPAIGEEQRRPALWTT